MVAPWMKLLGIAAKQAGKKMGHRVHTDSQIAARAVKYRGDEYTDLVTKDSGVASSWLEKLIGQSKNGDQLQSVRVYLDDSAKSSNLTAKVHNKLVEAIADKTEALEQQAFLKFLMEHRDKVKELLESLSDTIT